MADQIEIPGSFPDGADVTGKRVVITGAGRGLGRLLAHAFSDRGARVALVAAHRHRPQGGRRGAPGAEPRVLRRRDRRGVQRRGRRCRGRRVGWRRRLDLQCGDLAHRGRTARDRPVGLARGDRREPHGRVPRCPRRGTGDARRRATDLHRFGAGGAAARGTHCVQRVEGRAGRHGEGAGARPRRSRASR